MKKTTLLALSAAALFCGISPAQEGKKAESPSVFSKFPVKFYGYVKLDMSYDDSRTTPGNFVKWVNSESSTGTDDDAQVNVTANQTRFGFKVMGPEFDGIKTGALIEMDFYGGSAENKAHPRMRHAYAWAAWKKQGFKLIAGQTWDLVGLKNYCPTLNLHPGWWAGNIGFRHPQLSGHWTWKLEGDKKLEGSVGLFRTVGTASGNPPFTPGDTGEDADYPTVQGRLGLWMPLMAGKAMFALSGHFGTEEYDTTVTGTSEDMDSYSICFDFSLPFTKKITLNGCFWTGENMDDVLGGIGQGVTGGANPKEIAATGGFLNLCLRNLVKDWHFNFGFGIDDPDDDDLAAGARAKNTTAYGNAKYWITKDLMTGVELTWWETEYKGGDDGDAIRVQFSVKYSF